MLKKPVEVNITEIEEILDKYLNADSDINYAVKIVGHPGVGKSSIVRQIAEKRNYLFIDTRLAFKENIDLGGYPVPDHNEKRMVYYRPKFIPPEEVPDGMEGIVWFLDEANRAHPTVIQTLFQIITERTCGEHNLPSKTAIILAGNLGEDDSTVIAEFDDSALDGRLAIFHLKPSVENWLAWAGKADIHPSIIHYISMYPERLWDEKNIHPNPRGWHQVSQALILSHQLSTEEELSEYLSKNPGSVIEKVIVSLVGEIAGYDFIMQVTAPREISSYQIITGNSDKLLAMQKGELPAEDVLWALTGAVSYIREKNIVLKNDFSGDDLTELGNILKFIGYARSDSRMSFFYMLLKECGIMTIIPKAAATIEDDNLKSIILDKFEQFLGVQR